MKAPDEIKKGLECCIDWGNGCAECPYDNLSPDECVVVMKSDNLDLIQQQEQQLAEKDARIAELERERDAAVERLRGWCEVCVHWENEESIAFCDGCTHNYPFEHETNFTDRWQWRGVQEVE